MLDRVDKIDAPVLLHIGSEDLTIPGEHVDAIAKALKHVAVPTTQDVYAGAGHAFACDARPNMYRAEAAAIAWERTFAFIAEHLPRTS